MDKCLVTHEELLAQVNDPNRQERLPRTEQRKYGWLP